jgi:hypothetical protein
MRMNIEEWIEKHEHQQDGYSNLVVSVDALEEFMKGKVVVDAGSLAIVLACVTGGIAITRTELDTATSRLQAALLKPASSQPQPLHAEEVKP